LRLLAPAEQIRDLAARLVERLGERAMLDLAQPHARQHREHADLGLPQLRELRGRNLEARSHRLELAARILEHALDRREQIVAAQHFFVHHLVIAAPVVATV